MSDRIQKFYNSDPQKEWNRLSNPFQIVEFLSTLHLIEKYFPASGHLCDIGSGPGRYSVELLKRGYKVSMLDYSNELLELARLILKRENLHAEQIVHASAVHMPQFASNSFEGGLLFGPLYHLLKKEERLQTLHEFRRILKKGAIGIASYINSWGVIKSGINDFPDKYRDSNNLKLLLGEILYDNSQGGGFTESYWTTPPVALEEVKEAGFEVISYSGAEGFVSGMEPLIANLSKVDPEAYQSIIKFSAEHSELPQYRDTTEHIHIVIKKPSAP